MTACARSVSDCRRLDASVDLVARRGQRHFTSPTYETARNGHTLGPGGSSVQRTATLPLRASGQGAGGFAARVPRAPSLACRGRVVTELQGRNVTLLSDNTIPPSQAIGAWHHDYVVHYPAGRRIPQAEHPRFPASGFGARRANPKSCNESRHHRRRRTRGAEPVHRSQRGRIHARRRGNR